MQRELLAEAEQLTEQANIIWNEGRYPETEPLCTKALKLTRQALGNNDPRVAERLYNLASLYHFQNRFEEAKPLYQEAIQIHESQPAPDTAALAFCYGWLGKTIFEGWRDNPAVDGDLDPDLPSNVSFQDAEACYLQALKLLEGCDYAESPERAACLMHLAFLYYYTGRNDEAETIYRRAFALREKLFGPDHLETAECVGRLAILYYFQEEFKIDPEPYFLRALEIRERNLEPDHPERIEWLYRTAEFYHSRKRAVKAQRLFERLASLLDALPEETLVELEWVTSGYLDYLRATRRESEAAALEARLCRQDSLRESQRREAVQREAMLGPDHPHLAESLCALASTLRFEEEYAESEAHYLRALAIREKAFGATSSSLMEILNGLALLYRFQERYEEARAVLERARSLPLDGTQRHGIEYARTLEHLAWVEAALGQMEGAEPLFQHAVTLVEEMPHTDFRILAEMRYRLSLFYSQQERYPESEDCLLKTLTAAEQTPEVYDLDIADYREQYAFILSEMGREREAQQQLAVVKSLWQHAGTPRDDL